MLHQSQRSGNQLILVVDDSQTDLKRAALLLEKQGVGDVLTAESGPEALSLLDHSRPDLVITDLQMPELNGLELLHELHVILPDLPVVIMTAAGSEKIAIQCLMEGAASYVPKSDMAFSLSKTVQRLLERVQKSSDRDRLQRRIRSLEYEIENDLCLISSLTRELHSLIQQSDCFTEGVCLRISTAIDEALLNAYYHGNLEVSSELREGKGDRFRELAEQRSQISPYKNRRINIKLGFSSEAVTIRIRDQGPGFEVDALPDPTADAFLGRSHGRGVLLMKSFMDVVQFNDLGNEVSMRKHINTNSKPDPKLAQTQVRGGIQDDSVST